MADECANFLRLQVLQETQIKITGWNRCRHSDGDQDHAQRISSLFDSLTHLYPKWIAGNKPEPDTDNFK